MFARVTTMQMWAQSLDEATEYARTNLLPELRRLPGFRGMYRLVNRKTGRTLVITLWETEEAMRHGALRAQQLREVTATSGLVGLPIAETYEVVIETSEASPVPSIF